MTPLQARRSALAAARQRPRSVTAGSPTQCPERRNEAVAVSGDVFDGPEHVGEPKLSRPRGNSADIEAVPAGFTDDEPGIEV
jgi:hypothetical protein